MRRNAKILNGAVSFAVFIGRVRKMTRFGEQALHKKQYERSVFSRPGCHLGARHVSISPTLPQKHLTNHGQQGLQASRETTHKMEKMGGDV